MKLTRIPLALSLAALTTLSLLGCGGGGGDKEGPDPTPTPAPTATPAPTPSPSPTPGPINATGRVRYSEGANTVESNPDGTNKVVVGPAQKNGALSPDGTKVAYFGDTTIRGNPEIYVANVDGTNAKPLGVAARGGKPAWSPDGTKIAYASNGAPIDGGSSPELWTINPDGTNAQQVTVGTSAGYGSDFAWSPDGTKFVFAAFIAGEQRAYVMNADGTGVRRLMDPTKYNGPERDVRWTKSNKIYYRSLSNIFTLYRANPDGSGYESVFDEISGSVPLVGGYTLSPDEKFVAFTKDSDLYVGQLGVSTFQKLATGGSVVDWR